jgi:hypothetical protein
VDDEDLRMEELEEVEALLEVLVVVVVLLELLTVEDEDLTVDVDRVVKPALDVDDTPLAVAVAAGSFPADAP